MAKQPKITEVTPEVTEETPAPAPVFVATVEDAPDVSVPSVAQKLSLKTLAEQEAGRAKLEAHRA